MQDDNTRSFATSLKLWVTDHPYLASLVGAIIGFALVVGAFALLTPVKNPGQNIGSGEGSLNVVASGRSAPPAPLPKVNPVYDPPCFGQNDNEHSCTDRIYGKRLLEGTIDTVNFVGDEPTVSDGHLQPDYTEITVVSPYEGQDELKEKFCGNVLENFTPGKKIRMVIKESKQSDYNDCYVVEITTVTIGGKSPMTAYHKSTVPGSPR